MEKLEIRIAKKEDASRLLEIYAPYVKTTPITFEYEVPSLEEFQTRIETISESYPYLVAVVEGEIAGYAYATAFKSRAAYQWAVETSIYLDGNFHGKGIARALYEKLEAILKRQNIYTLSACITYPNNQSISFHEKSGYLTVAHFHKCGFKLGQWRDVVWMEKTLQDHPAIPEPMIPFSDISCDYQ